MIYRIDNFEKKTPSNIEFFPYKLACGDFINIYTIKTVHDLTQFIGFGKYKNNNNHNVFLRGQTELYNGSLIPSLYRSKTRFDSITYKFNKNINDLRSNISSFSNYERVILEPLLQHYGVKTPYIDLVDNVWVALWFALHQAKNTIINSHEYIYFYENENEFSYVLLIASDATTSSSNRGVFEGTETTLIDLRKSLPSYFLRPHAQHAYMLRKNERFPNDYSNLIVGIAQIPTQLGLKWLGNNDFLTTSSLFPAAYFDSGYELILKKYPQCDPSFINHFGSIQIITD